MTIAVRNRIINSGTALIALFALSFPVALALLFRMAPVQILRFDSDIAPLALALFCELLFCASTIVILYFSFRKTASAEIFFFILFIVSMSFDSLKMVHVLLDAAPVAPYFGTIVTRAIYFGRFFGVLSLFSCGLFATGLPYERLEVVFVAGMLLSLTLASTIPIDMTRSDSWFAMPIGFAKEIQIVTWLLYGIAVVNFVFAAHHSGNRNYLLVAAGVALVIGGRETLFYRLDVLSITISFVLLVTGATIVGERTHEIYLWS